MLGTDYPFPLGEVQIVDTYPAKVILESDFISKHVKVSAKKQSSQYTMKKSTKAVSIKYLS